MTPEQKIVWTKLQSFQFNPEGATKTFEMRLAEEQRWSAAYAERVVEEYKRFVFLCWACSHPCTPSEIIDEAWHQHLVYSRSYWEDLCAQVLGKPLHHEPGFGLPGQSAGHSTAFADTLISYEQLFETPPPSDIWRAQPVQPAAVATRRAIPRSWFVLAGLSAAVIAVAVGCASSEQAVGPSPMIPLFFVLGFGLIVFILIAIAIARARGFGGPGGYYGGNTYMSNCSSPPIFIDPLIVVAPIIIDGVAQCNGNSQCNGNGNAQCNGGNSPDSNSSCNSGSSDSGSSSSCSSSSCSSSSCSS